MAVKFGSIFCIFILQLWSGRRAASLVLNLPDSFGSFDFRYSRRKLLHRLNSSCCLDYVENRAKINYAQLARDRASWQLREMR